jgi:cardiolipin synthase
MNYINKGYIGGLSMGRDIQLLIDGERAFARIIQRIREAKQSIHINMFIWRDDKIGNKIAQEIVDAADRGVKICIIKDKMGEIFEKAEENKQSFFHKKFSLGLWLMAVAVDIMYPMEGKGKSRKQRPNALVHKLVHHPNIHVEDRTIRRDHSKYYIFDENILIMGGMNIEDKTVYTDALGRKYNDFMVEIADPGYVIRLVRRLRGDTAFDGQSPVEFIFNTKKDNKMIFDIKPRIIEILSSARESIDIVMAYIGDKDIMEKIIECANRGVRINVLLPVRSNIQHDLNMKVLKGVMESTAGKINVYLSDNMVHGKLIRVDNRIVTLGSTNLNKQAMNKLSELNVVIRDYDEDFSRFLEEGIQRGMAAAKRIDEGYHITFNPLKAVLEQMI